MAMGPWQLAIIAVLVLLLFGRGKISTLMGDVGNGITAFKNGLKDTEANPVATTATAEKIIEKEATGI